MKKINGIPLILILLKRLSLSKKISKIVIATTDEKSDDILTSILLAEKFEVVRGSSENVLKRFIKVLKNYSLIKSDKNFTGSLIFDEYPRTSFEKNL